MFWIKVLLGDPVVSPSRMDLLRHPEFTQRVDSYLKQWEFNRTRISAQTGGLQGGSPLNTCVLIQYNLHFVIYSPISFWHMHVMFLQIGIFLLLLLWVGYLLLSPGYVASGAIFGQHVPPPSIRTTQIPTHHHLVLHNDHYIPGLSHTELIVQPETSPNLLMLNNSYLSS